MINTFNGVVKDTKKLYGKIKDFYSNLKHMSIWLSSLVTLITFAIIASIVSFFFYMIYVNLGNTVCTTVIYSLIAIFISIDRWSR